MSFKKYRAYYSEKEKVNAIQEIKENIIALERDVIKIHKNLKRISREIHYLYDTMSPSSESSELSSSEEIEEGFQRDQVNECYQPKNRRVKYRRRSQIIE